MKTSPGLGHSVLAVIVALLTATNAAENEPKSCTAHDCGHSYDLSPLSASSDYVFTSHTGRNFTLNVCRSVVSDLWNPRVDRPQDVGGFTRGARGDISIGQANSTLHVRDRHPVLLLMGGSSCPQSDSMKASTAIRFICDDSVAEGKPQLIAQLPPEDDDACAFFIEWRTKFACPVPDRYAYWKTFVMVIVILLALSLTLLALLALHRLIKRRRDHDVDTYDALPLGSSPRRWYTSFTPYALAENARDLKRLLTGQDPWGNPSGPGRGTSGSSGVRGSGWRPSFPWGRRDRQSFTRLPRNAEEEAMMGGGGGPFSVDDEEDDHHEVNGNGRVPDSDSFAEESAAWGAARPRGLDGSGVIRL
ncbi:mannose 6-phosphate receptor domain-containing protein [Phellopilus nigrolimitatus]|nr:mannose 6-phosphate receptor domain-containing protein [Phellopilus nigrolimitatus]